MSFLEKVISRGVVGEKAGKGAFIQSFNKHSMLIIGYFLL